MENSSKEWAIRRAGLADLELAWQIVEEYYEAAQVVARDTKPDFAQSYFREGAGFWLAMMAGRSVGCIALRQQGQEQASGEVKRLYVQSAWRGRGLAAALYEELEKYAREVGYDWLYLDTAAEMREAQRFYRQLGFEHCERYNDNAQASIFMRKRLS